MVMDETRHPKFVLQLFNGAPRRLRGNPLVFDTPPVLTRAGWQVATLAPYCWPWNPFAQMHNAYRGLDPLRALRVLLFERQADLICAHLESAAVLILLRKLFFFRSRIMIWEVPWSPGWRFRDAVSNFVLPRADFCVVFGTSQRALVEARYGDGIKVAFVPFRVDTDFFKPDANKSPSREFIWSCGLDDGRDFTTLLDASRTIDVPVRIRAPCNALPASTALPNVTLETAHLPREEFRDRYARASIVVVSTKDTPNASGVTSLLEALAMGRPTIVTDNPALRDYFPPPDAVIVIPIGDGDALREAILRLLADPLQAERMGQKGRQFVEDRFSLDRHYHHMAAAFAAALTQK